MSQRKRPLDRFSGLTWNDLDKWAGSKIVSRGRDYQRNGRVSDLAVTDDGALIAWVDGSKRYATRVAVAKKGLPESMCTCPYTVDCKHGVAVVIECLTQLERNGKISRAVKNDERLALIEDMDWDDESDEDEPASPSVVTSDLDTFLKGKTKTQLIGLIRDLAEKHMETAQDLADRRQIVSGNVQSLATRLRRDIREIGAEPGWKDYWRGEGYTPDYSGIRTRLGTLLKEGHADVVLALGEELIKIGTRQAEESHDEGETEMEVAECMPVIVRALDASSLPPEDKLTWAVDAVLKDQFEICEAFAEYLHRAHAKAAWCVVADQLLDRLHKVKFIGSADGFSRDYARDRLSDWAIHALERAGRNDEIVSLCEAEAKKTDSYDRLVKRLISAGRHEDAERWIREGIRTIAEKWPGIASNLRDRMREIRTRQRNWPTVAALQAEEFVRSPSRQAFADCRAAAVKVKAWTMVRQCLLRYLENGVPPWTQEGWPLPASGLDVPETGRRMQFPMIHDLIDLAILEKKPDQVLHWYDQIPERHSGWQIVNEDAIATAVKTHAPDRAVSLWKKKAERLIGQVKPRAYQEAALYLRKAGEVMAGAHKQVEWDRYLTELRAVHIRKLRLIEILNGLDDKPIVKKKR